MLRQLLADESGFLVCTELVLVATIVVIGLIVGLSEVQHAVVAELNDVADAIGTLNQSYYYSGMASRKQFRGISFKAVTYGSVFVDVTDECDNNQCALACAGAAWEGPKFGGGAFGGGAFGGGFWNF